MGIASGSVSLRRFQILKNPHDVKQEWILEHIRKASISPLSVNDIKEESVGWCRPDNGSGEFSQVDDLFLDDGLHFGLRVDKKKIPSTYFRIKYQEALQQIQEDLASKAEGEKKLKISRKTREETKEKLRHEMLKRCLPAVSVVELFWQLDKGEVWLANTGSGVFSRFEKLFWDSFGLPFVELNPGTMQIDFDRYFAGQKIDFASLLDVLPLSFKEDKKETKRRKADEQRELET